MWSAQRLLKYGIVTGVTLGTLASLKANQYNFDSIGVVRLGRAAVTVSNLQRWSAEIGSFVQISLWYPYTCRTITSHKDDIEWVMLLFRDISWDFSQVTTLNDSVKYWTHERLTNSLVQSYFWAASTFSASQEISWIWLDAKVHYCAYRSSHLSISWARWFQLMPSHPICCWPVLLLINGGSYSTIKHSVTFHNAWIFISAVLEPQISRVLKKHDVRPAVPCLCLYNNVAHT